MSLIERCLTKFKGNTKGLDFNLCDWHSPDILDKMYWGKPLTKSELAACAFFEEIGEVLNRWSPPEKWEKPTGDVLNEHRKLH